MAPTLEQKLRVVEVMGEPAESMVQGTGCNGPLLAVKFREYVGSITVYPY
jgi:hypothetical protein